MLKKKTKLKISVLVAVALAAALLFALLPHGEDGRGTDGSPSAPSAEARDLALEKIAAFADRQDLDLSEYPEALVDLLAANPDAEEFVLYYPLRKDFQPEIDLSEHKNSQSVPLFFQWDERWGYNDYGGELFGLSGCGPTCLSMVCVYLQNDTRFTPMFIAEFSKKYGYCTPGSGSAWTLISEGGERLGLDVVEIPLDKDRIIRNLEVGNPIICIMGPGDFTTSGHFIVLVDYVDGKLKINDPNSRVRSEKLWDYDDIKDQIRNLWVCR